MAWIICQTMEVTFILSKFILRAKGSPWQDGSKAFATLSAYFTNIFLSILAKLINRGVYSLFEHPPSFAWVRRLKNEILIKYKELKNLGTYHPLTWGCIYIYLHENRLPFMACASRYVVEVVTLGNNNRFYNWWYLA